MNIYTNERKRWTGKLQKFEARPTDYVGKCGVGEA